MYAEERDDWQMGRGNRDAHNMYVSLAAESGLPGLAIFLGMIGSALLSSMRTERDLRARFPIEAEQLRILRFGLIAYLIAAIFGSFHRASFLYLYVAALRSASTLFEALLTSAGSLGRASVSDLLATSTPLRGTALVRRNRMAFRPR